MNYKFKHAIVGGTFDRLHEGHRFFLNEAFKYSEKVTIGITNDTFFKDKIRNEIIENVLERKKSITDFLRKEGLIDRAKVIVIDDIFGNTLTEKDINAIFISETGLANAQLINEKRKEINFPPLQIVIIPLVTGKNRKEISSTGIRMGEIDRKGDSNMDIFYKTQELILPESLRETLRNPFGDKVKNLEDLPIQKDDFVVAVGDITVSLLVASGRIPDISIYDLISQRKTITEEKILKSLPLFDKEFENKPATINSKTVIKIHDLISESVIEGKKIAIKIIGEEDLLALPLILLAPLNAIVLFGLPGIGFVKVNATEENKRKVKDYLEQFIKK